ncbi:stage II sporulation protein M [Sporosarcina aquimarina]|uniref:stage II sporulation protein M n=1 Tax=Sporosarcina aquimarina TaxID=114975 RepID=UPI001C8DD915|nr:stage II sporulation protein M [Sporosarcina aquimarina]MBY0223893.1 stage II sporulation protein M [Sporosarcina aquimarina]
MPNIIDKALFKRAIKFFIFAASITILAAIITYIINPDLKEVMKGIDSRASEQVKEATGVDKVWSYIVNNGFMVPFQMFILALIPIQFLYFLNIITTVSLPGILFGVALQSDFGKGFEIILSSLPHYVFEVFALCLLAAALFELNRVIRANIKNIFKKDRLGLSFIKPFLATVRTYAFFVLPIIILAALLETYIADFLYNLF